MDVSDTQNNAMQIIVKAGDGRSRLLQAVTDIENGDFTAARFKLESAGDAIREAHTLHTEMIRDEARGNTPVYSMLLAHAQDALMTAYSEYRVLQRLLPTLENYDIRLRALEDVVARGAGGIAASVDEDITAQASEDITAQASDDTAEHEGNTAA